MLKCLRSILFASVEPLEPMVGLLKSYVEKAKFEGYEVDLWLGRGWFSKSFMMKGDARVIGIIVKKLEDIAKDV